jgi:hypothetical protein
MATDVDVSVNEKAIMKRMSTEIDGLDKEAKIRILVSLLGFVEPAYVEPVLDALEDVDDVRACETAKADESPTIPLETVKQQLGF